MDEQQERKNCQVSWAKSHISPQFYQFLQGSTELSKNQSLLLHVRSWKPWIKIYGLRFPTETTWALLAIKKKKKPTSLEVIPLSTSRSLNRTNYYTNHQIHQKPQLCCAQYFYFSLVQMCWHNSQFFFSLWPSNKDRITFF